MLGLVLAYAAVRVRLGNGEWVSVEEGRRRLSSEGSERLALRIGSGDEGPPNADWGLGVRIAPDS